MEWGGGEVLYFNECCQECLASGLGAKLKNSWQISGSKILSIGTIESLQIYLSCDAIPTLDRQTLDMTV